MLASDPDCRSDLHTYTGAELGCCQSIGRDNIKLR
jgi:hypothetical protein